MAKAFEFLARAKPASLYRLLEKLTPGDAAIVLAGLPHAVAIQVMAYYPDERQGDLLPAMREARRADPEQTEKTAGRIRDMLRAAKMAREAAPPEAPPAESGEPAGPRGGPMPPLPEKRDGQTGQPSRRREARAYETGTIGPGGDAPAGPEKRDNRIREARISGEQDTPERWAPRAATGSPINGPALPGCPPPVAGDPLRSPLAQAGLMELLGRARDRLLPGASAGAGGGGMRPTSRERAEPREGFVRGGSIGVGRTPRTVGPRARPAPDPKEGARPMDGKAILAAILREAGPAIRGQVRDESPDLFRELRGRMFHFDDLMYTEDGALARVFTAAPTGEAALALRFAAPALRDRVYRAVSPGRARALREAREERIGLDAVEGAQKAVLGVALKLQAAGRILIDPRDPDLAG